jgi:hypothetical protein
MVDPEHLEPGTHVFTGTVQAWGSELGVLLTDSGVAVTIITEGYAPVPEGTRLTLVTRRLRPRYQIMSAHATE